MRDAPVFALAAALLAAAGPAHAAPAERLLSPDGRIAVEVQLEPRSGYVLAGKARTSWQHSIPPTNEERYSITFRTLRWGA